MESLTTGVDWTAVVVGAVLAYMAGWAWYSFLFGKKWRAGVGISEDDNSPMGLAMFAQAGAIFFLSWVIGITASMEALPLAILFVATTIGIVKANGLFVKKSHAAIAIEASFILVMAIIMIATHAII